MNIERLTLEVGAMSEADAHRLPLLLAEALRGWNAPDAHRIVATVAPQPGEPVEHLAQRIAREAGA